MSESTVFTTTAVNAPKTEAIDGVLTAQPAEGSALLTWTDDASGKAAYGDIMIDIDVKPQLSFAYKSLYYEPEHGLMIKLDATSGPIPLTADEMTECLAMAKTILTSSDYTVFIITEDDVFGGTMQKSEAIEQKKRFTLIAPDHSASKWIDGKWERVVAVIMENGQLRLMPDSMCQLCLLFFTANEWALFKPKPKTPVETYNFKTETWSDTRNVANMRDEAKTVIRQVFDDVRNDANTVPLLERETWITQKEEAVAWLNDNTAETPFLDIIIDPNVRSKEDLCKDIVANANEQKRKNAMMHKEQWRCYAELDKCITCDDIETYLRTFASKELTYAAVCEEK